MLFCLYSVLLSISIKCLLFNLVTPYYINCAFSLHTVGGFMPTEPGNMHTLRRATTSMSVPIGLGYGLGSAPPPTQDKSRPKTANPVMEKQKLFKSELSQEKAFR